MGPEPVNSLILAGFWCFVLVSDTFQLCFHCLTLSASRFSITATRLPLMLGVKDPRFPGDAHGLI